MTITLFISILTVGAAITTLLTEAIKKAYENAKKPYSANVIALVNAIIVGAGGTSVTYMLTGVDWTANNIICMALMVLAVWMGSMLGFDKVLQLVNQLKDAKEENK